MKTINKGPFNSQVQLNFKLAVIQKFVQRLH